MRVDSIFCWEPECCGPKKRRASIEAMATLLTKGNCSIRYTQDELVAHSLEEIDPILEQHGIVICRGFILNDLADYVHDSLCNDVTRITSKFAHPFNLEMEPQLRTIRLLNPMQDVIIPQWGLAHNVAVWHGIRTNPFIMDVFAKLYGVNPLDLLASMEPIHMGYPDKCYSGHKKLILSQGNSTFQGWAPLRDVVLGAATIRFLDGGHKYYDAYNHRFGPSQKEQVLSEAQYHFYQQECRCKDSAIMCKKGDLVVWKSSLPHAVIEAWTTPDLLANNIPVPTPPSLQFFTMAVPISYMPRHMVKPPALRYRYQTLLDPESDRFGRTYTHRADLRKIHLKEPFKKDWDKVTPLKPDPRMFSNDTIRRIAGIPTAHELV